MSRNYSASQYDKGFSPARLGNWEVPKPAPPPPAEGLKTADGRTIPIADSNGHIVKGKKKAAAFAAAAPSPPRWPQPSPTVKSGGAATMGYKGIQTDYLPSSTVVLKTVELPGCKEGVNYAGL